MGRVTNAHTITRRCSKCGAYYEDADQNPNEPLCDDCLDIQHGVLTKACRTCGEKYKTSAENPADNGQCPNCRPWPAANGVAA